GDTQGEWQPVNCFGAAGFVHASFIAWQAPAAPTTADTSSAAATDAAAAPTTDDRASADAANCAAGKRGKNGDNNKCGGGNNGGTSGQQIANYAQQYVGYPYVYAGAGPDAFDCSGFTMYVIKQTLGLDIT